VGFGAEKGCPNPSMITKPRARVCWAYPTVYPPKRDRMAGLLSTAWNSCLAKVKREQAGGGGHFDSSLFLRLISLSCIMNNELNEYPEMFNMASNTSARRDCFTNGSDFPRMPCRPSVLPSHHCQDLAFRELLCTKQYSR
jgi:hypothetical protein